MSVITIILEIELEEIPHYDTINNVFEKINIEELRKIQKYMVNRLIRSKMFDKYRFKGKYFQIVIDGTNMMKFKKRHCKHCLKRVHNEGKEYMWIVSFKITARNSKEIINFGRQRWRIENEGFNIQKNGTFDIEHVYSQNYNAIKAHYFFIQFAHTIRQLLEKGIKYIIELKISKKEVSALLTQALTHTIANLTENNKIQLRFVLKLSI